MRDLLGQLRTGLTLLLLFSVLMGLIYPGFVTCFAQLFFHWKANGSLIQKNNQVIGSALIGQPFNAQHYFWGRPSATSPFPYNAKKSSGSNLGPSNPELVARIKERITIIKQLNPESKGLIPLDLVTASGSGLDPDISPVAAFYQVPRIAKARGIPENTVALLIKKSIKQRILGILGEARVNVLELNLALDRLQVKPQ